MFDGRGRQVERIRMRRTELRKEREVNLPIHVNRVNMDQSA